MRQAKPKLQRMGRDWVVNGNEAQVDGQDVGLIGEGLHDGAICKVPEGSHSSWGLWRDGAVDHETRVNKFVTNDELPSTIRDCYFVGQYTRRQTQNMSSYKVYQGNAVRDYSYLRSVQGSCFKPAFPASPPVCLQVSARLLLMPNAVVGLLQW